MAILPRKGMLAIAAVIDIALNAKGRPVSAKALADRQELPSRHLEPVLQALVRRGILRGIRGPGGGYELGQDARSITADQILRAASCGDELEEFQQPTSPLIVDVVIPAIAQAEKAFSEALVRVNVEDLARSAGPHVGDGHETPDIHLPSTL